MYVWVKAKHFPTGMRIQHIASQVGVSDRNSTTPWDFVEDGGIP